MAGPMLVNCPVDGKPVHRKNMLAHFKAHHPKLVPAIPAGKIRLRHNWWEGVTVPTAKKTPVVVTPKVTRRVVKPTVDGIMEAVLKAAHPSGAVPIKALPAIEPLRESIEEYLNSV